jgi:vacuolar protein sorting-associated protein 26
MYRISFAYRVQINLICRGNHYEFLSLAQELAAPGEMRQAQSFDFNFKNVEKQYESYSGINVKLRSVKLCLLWLTWAKLIYRVLTISYFLRCTIHRRMGDILEERDIWVHSFRMPPDSNMAIKMEVGIEDCLHIEFEYNKAKSVFRRRT